MSGESRPAGFIVRRMDPIGYLDLADWRRQTAELYASVRAAEDPRAAWSRWRRERDRLFREHPQSPLPVGHRESFTGIAYFDYDEGARVVGELSEVDQSSHEVPTSTGEPMVFERFARIHFELYARELSLEVYWLTVYGGGIFLPFRDATGGTETYGGGRYLWDSIKGADLGSRGDRLMLDFNFAYNPSCSYDPRWTCPLSPPANHLPVEIRAGEKSV